MLSSDFIRRRLDQLDGLYQRDPELFEERSRQLIRQAIDSFPPEHRRRALGMQFQLEARLRRYQDPVARMNAMVEIFWEQVLRFQQVVNHPLRSLDPPEQPATRAKVLPFRPVH